MWTGKCSSLFGKDDMTTFERYFIEEKETHVENKNPYYTLREDEDICKKLFDEFELDINDSHIINGHVPVKSKSGESPIKANGKILVIDGGFSKAYQDKTGIAGYTPVSYTHLDVYKRQSHYCFIVNSEFSKHPFNEIFCVVYWKFSNYVECTSWFFTYNSINFH